MTPRFKCATCGLRKADTRRGTCATCQVAALRNRLDSATAGRETIRRGVIDLLARNSVVVSPTATSDEQLIAALFRFLGSPGLAEQLLLGIKRRGAVTAYRELTDEGVKVRFACTRLDERPWPQSPQDGPGTVEILPGGHSVPRSLEPLNAAVPIRAHERDQARQTREGWHEPPSGPPVMVEEDPFETAFLSSDTSEGNR